MRASYEAARAHVPNVNYSLNDIARLCDNKYFHSDNSWGFGVFVSALINRVIRDGDVITIALRPWVGDSYLDSYLGIFLERGTVVLDAVAGYGVGMGQRGGKIVAKGLKANYGDHMEGGELTVDFAGDGGLNHMRGGHAIIKKIAMNPGDCPEGYRQILSSWFYGLGAHQQGGKIEILCDVPYIPAHEATGIGAMQDGNAELIVVGDVYGPVNSKQVGGTTRVQGNVLGSHEGVAREKKGGTTIIEGSVGRASDHCPVGCRQRGGLTEVMGDVHGSVGYDGYPRAEIRVHGNVFGEVAGYRTAGTRILIDGSVKGDVACNTDDLYCIVGGRVTGKVGYLLGHGTDTTKPKRESYLEIKGDVIGDVGDNLSEPSRVYVRGNISGTVGQGMNGGRIEVNGRIQQVGRCFGGKIYQSGRDVTNIPLWVSALDLFFKKDR